MNFADQLRDVFKVLLETPVNTFDITSALKNTIIDVGIQRYISFSLLVNSFDNNTFSFFLKNTIFV